jgi:ADP-heptose:LPS heptosyltransferase
MQSLLVVRLSSLGDVILSTAVPRWLHNQWPQARIDVAVFEQFCSVYDNNPRIRNVHRVVKGAESTLLIASFD